MPRLRFETDRGQATLQQLRQTVEIMRDEMNRAGSSADNLVGGAWQAPAAEEFYTGMNAWRQQFGQTLEDLTQLNNRLEAEIQEWEETARFFGDYQAPPIDTTPPPSLIPIKDLPEVKEKDKGDWKDRIKDKFLTGTDKLTKGLLEELLPSDIDRADEFITIKGEAGATIPLQEFGIPASGYVNVEDGITVWRTEDGTYRVSFNSVDSGGADVGGPQAGLRGEKTYEFEFNPNDAGDLSKMGLLVTTICGTTILGNAGLPYLEQVTKSVSTVAMRDNLTNVKTAAGLEAAYKDPAGLKGELTAMVGQEVRRGGLDDGSWEQVTSFKLTGEVKGEIPLLQASVSPALTFNSVVEAGTGHQYTEVVLEVEASVGASLSAEDFTGLLPPGTGISLNNDVQKLEITYTLHEPIDNIIDTVQTGNFNAIVNNSELKVSGSTGLTSTIGRELDLGIAGVKLEGEATKGYEYDIVEIEGNNVH